jgi:hypothetical protein
MDQPVATTCGISPWVWLISMGGFGILCIVVAVRQRELGLAISGAGFMLLAATAFLAAPPFNANLREFFRPPHRFDPRVAYLGAIGAALNAIGLVTTWLG